MAVMSTVSGGDLRSGLYATRSMTTPNRTQTRTLKIAPTQVGRPHMLTHTMTVNAPTIIISPWAKFSILAMP